MNISYILALALSELKQVWNNKRFIFLLVVAPVMMSLVFGFVAYHLPQDMSTTIFVDKPSGAAVSPEIQKIIDGMRNFARDDGSKPFAVTVESKARDKALQSLKNGDTRAVVVLTQGSDGQLAGVKAVCSVGEPGITSEIERQLGSYFDRYSREISAQKLKDLIARQGGTASQAASGQAAQILSGVETVVTTDAWTDLKYFDYYASAMIVVGAIAMPLILSVLSVTAERTKGSIERIFASPYSKSEIIGGKIVAYSLFAMLFVALFLLTLKLAFDVTLGNLGLTVLMAFLVGIGSAVLGLLVSSITYSESESVIIGIMGLLAIIALMPYMAPWEIMHPIARVLSGLVPFTYGIQAIREINMVGAGLAEVWPNLLILIGSIFGLALISIPVLKREVKN
jgi:ABC-2 type transport system permease protein